MWFALFPGKTWPGVQDLWRRISVDLEQWKILSKDAVSSILMEKSSAARQKTKGSAAHSLVNLSELPNFDPSTAIRISD
jgi:hypothetical protein